MKTESENKKELKNMEINKNENVFTNMNEQMNLLLYCGLIFIVPLLFNNQLIVGTVVNALLILSALKLKGNWSYVPAFIPSMAAMAGGIIFGFQHAVLLMLPFIWIGNMTLIYIFKSMNEKIGYAKTLIASSIAKTALLTIAIFALVTFANLPSQLINVFSYLQLVTAISGGILAFTYLHFSGK